jgi:hypothetical protein
MGRGEVGAAQGSLIGKLPRTRIGGKLPRTRIGKLPRTSGIWDLGFKATRHR